jgi:signal transduction histidine kinase
MTARRTQDGLLGRYSAQLVELMERSRAEEALRMAHREHAIAELARIDRINSNDPVASASVAFEFVAHMSHELRTPLNAIIGFSDMIRLRLKGAEVAPRILEYLDDINGAGWHLLRVINDILDLSKIDAGKLELSEEQVDLGEVVAVCARMVKGQMDEKRIVFAYEPPATTISVLADELKLKQVLINLLSNAAKFTPEGGRVALAAGVESSGAVIITVADNGIGIAPEDLAKVFTPFTQLNARVSRKYPGTGLGLPLSKALVELHGGALTVQSAPGEGSTFTVRFPPCRLVRHAA